MNTPPRDVRFSQESEIAKPNAERAYPIAHSEWYRLINRLKTCRSAGRFFDAAGWGLLGIAITAFFSAQTYSDGSTAQIIGFAVAGAALLSGGFALFFSSRHRADRQTLLDSVIDDMEDFASRFQVERDREMQSEAVAAFVKALEDEVRKDHG